MPADSHDNRDQRRQKDNLKKQGTRTFKRRPYPEPTGDHDEGIDAYQTELVGENAVKSSPWQCLDRVL